MRNHQKKKIKLTEIEKETIAKEYISKKLCQQFELSNGGKVIVIQNNFDVSVNTQTELVTLFPRSIITQNSELKEVLEEKSLLKDKNHLITLDDFKFLNFNSEVSSFCFPLEMKLPVGSEWDIKNRSKVQNSSNVLYYFGIKDIEEEQKHEF